MKSLKHGNNSGEDGKGSIGCILAIILMAAAVFLAFKLGPPYLSHYEFKGEMKQTVSRAGAHMMSEEQIKKDLIAIARKNNIVLEEKNIRITRTSSSVEISTGYTIPVNFIIMKRDLNFEVKESSYSL